MKKAASILLLWMMFIVPAYAKTPEATVPLTVRQEFQTSQTSVSSLCTYELFSEGTGEKYKISLTGKKAEKVISLTYDHAGSYSYTLTQTTPDKQGHTYDRTLYHITVYVQNAENGGLIPQVIVNSGGNTKVSELIFRNSLVEQEVPEDKPTTGVYDDGTFFGVLMVLSGITAAYVFVRK